MNLWMRLGALLSDRRLHLVIAYLLVAAAYLPGAWTNPRHEGDEATWISGSRYLEHYLAGRFEPQRWEQDQWRTNQSPVTFFAIGLGRRVGGYRWDELNRPWNYRLSVEQNDASGRRPSDDLVAWARLPMALLAVLAICLAHRVVRACAGDVAGYVWLLLCVASDYLRLHLVRAMCEAPLVASCVLGLALFSSTLARAWRQPACGRRGALVAVFGFGLTTGLAVSSKLNGLALFGAGVVLIGLLAAAMWSHLQARAGFVVAALALLLAGTAIPMVGLNPYLWPAPLERVVSLFDTRLATMSRQVAGYPAMTIVTLGQRLTIVPLRILQTYAAISHGRDVPSVVFTNLLFLVIGMARLVRQAVGPLRGRPSNPAAVAILLVGSAASLPPLFTPLDWNRYYVLPVFFTTMAIAIALAWLGQRLVEDSPDASAN